MEDLITEALKSKILILGAGGMLGHTLYCFTANYGSIEVLGTVRNSAVPLFPQHRLARLLPDVRVEDDGRIEAIIDGFRPALVVNCIAAGTAAGPKDAVALNSLLPHRISDAAKNIGARLLHFSTDGVFSGSVGQYSEDDFPDTTDLYGRSKLLGEVTDQHCLTVRTSIIGPEHGVGKGLVAWLSRQTGTVKGFRQVKFSGLTTFELSKVIIKYILPRNDLSGVLNVSSLTISKYELLVQIAKAYQLAVNIIPDDEIAIDRSLDSTRFQGLTGYEPPDWATMIAQMRGQN